MDEFINEYHKTLSKEQDLFFAWAETAFDGKEMEDYDWPEPSSSDLWFTGLKKYGKKLPSREYEIRERNRTGQLLEFKE